MNTDGALSFLRCAFHPFECHARTIDHGELFELKIVNDTGSTLLEFGPAARETIVSQDQVSALVARLSAELRGSGHAVA